jgi:shikimate dehydrogenase
MPPTRVFALIGWPVAHSRSPFIMNRAFAAIGLDATYVAIPVPARDLGAAVDGLALLRAGGANVTYPYKEAVIGHVDSLSEDAAAIGAVNTLLWNPEGAARGHNTDAEGAAEALARVVGLDAGGLRVFIFGAGGSARAAALGLARRGALRVTLASRSPQKTEPALARLRTAAGGASIDSVALGRDDLDARRAAFVEADVVVNATPVGMGGGAASILEDESWIAPHQCLFDFVYHPRRTAFLEAARRRGARTVGGLSLLVAQAAASFRLWTGREFDAAETAAALDALETRVGHP